jgi:hypothetical protein
MGHRSHGESRVGIESNPPRVALSHFQIKGRGKIRRIAVRREPHKMRQTGTFLSGYYECAICPDQGNRFPHRIAMQNIQIADIARHHAW